MLVLAGLTRTDDALASGAVGDLADHVATDYTKVPGIAEVGRSHSQPSWRRPDGSRSIMRIDPFLIPFVDIIGFVENAKETASIGSQPGATNSSTVFD